MKKLLHRFVIIIKIINLHYLKNCSMFITHYILLTIHEERTLLFFFYKHFFL
jgi:hypothetical protein